MPFPTAHRTAPRARHIAVVAVTTAAAVMLAGCSTPGTTSEATAPQTVAAPLRVGPLNTQNTLTLATDGGPLEHAVREAGGELVTPASFPAFAPAAEAVLAGQIDMTTGSATALVPVLAGGADVVVFAVEHNDGDTQGIVAGEGTGIGSVADLRGRTVAINEGGTGDYLLRLALTAEGLTIDDVEPVPLGPADAASAFAAGQVDAWATWDQYLAFAEEHDGVVIAHAADIGGTNRSVHVVSREVLTQNPDLVRAAFDALEEQAAAVAQDPALLRDAYVAAGTTEPVAERVAAVRPPTISPADEAFGAELQALATFYADQGLTPAPVDVSDAWVDIRTLP